MKGPILLIAAATWVKSDHRLCAIPQKFARILSILRGGINPCRQFRHAQAQLFDRSGELLRGMGGLVDLGRAADNLSCATPAQIVFKDSVGIVEITEDQIESRAAQEPQAAFGHRGEATRLPARAKRTHEDALVLRINHGRAIPEQRAQVTERIAHLVALERAVVAGVAPEDTALESLVDELTGWLRALLRDVLCGHLDSDLRTLADTMLREEDVRQQTVV